jgi:hypothetical protein
MSRTIHYGKRTAPSAFKVNKGKDFHNEYGMLKEGYNTTGGEGMVAVGTTTVTGTVGAGKDGMRGYSEQKTVFGPKDTPKHTPTPPAAIPETEKAPVKTSYKLSNRAAHANAATAAYEQELLPNQGTSFIMGSAAPGQAYKDAFQENLIQELKVSSPTTFAIKKAEIELADKQAVDLNHFTLNL